MDDRFGRRAVTVAAAVALGTTAFAGTAAADPPDPQLVAAVAHWVSAGGETRMTTLSDDFTALESAAGGDDAARIRDVCTRLGTDVAAAQAYAPIPDRQAQHSWAAALAAYRQGAADCVAGIAGDDATLITKAADEITAGSDDIDGVTVRLNEIVG